MILFYELGWGMGVFFVDDNFIEINAGFILGFYNDNNSFISALSFFR